MFVSTRTCVCNAYIGVGECEDFVENVLINGVRNSLSTQFASEFSEKKYVRWKIFFI